MGANDDDGGCDGGASDGGGCREGAGEDGDDIGDGG